MNRTRRSPVYFMALTIFIDFAGFSIVLPLLPFWAERLGAGPVGVGLVLTIYALAQFIFTPVLGTLSDRYGRRPIILASLLIEALSVSIGDGAVAPVVSALLPFASPPTRQGETLGLAQGVAGMGRVINPLAADRFS